MRANHISVQLARVHDRVRDLLLAVEETDLPSRSSYSVDDAVTALRQRPSHAEKIS
jgi:hypothetical protein